MFRPASRTVLRAAAQSSLAPARTIVPRRFASSSPASSKRSWKNTAARWGIAIAGLYYYNTSPVFADQPSTNLLNPNTDALEDAEEYSTLDALTSRQKARSENAAALHSAVEEMSTENASTTSIDTTAPPLSTGPSGGAEELEQEAASEGAFNPETGEINWDCPCLGGMAYGPCGEEFREAFSCFVFSTEEPKGMDCIDKFQGMQQCFQRHPEVYKGELEDDEELDAELEGERQKLVDEIAERKAQHAESVAAAPQRRLLEEPVSEPTPARASKAKKNKEPKAGSEQKQSIGDQKISEFVSDAEVEKEGSKSATASSDILPRAAHDARDHVEGNGQGTGK
ncbi:hypothetical protein PV10_00900 [Exophiala mesophila]|uniref:Mitochondrial intermembrane space import and assembly protein 40 n=1 Tax=Exophiala mesophila TaxID=212818 RepID=A0A0D1ZT75_EXOME|nr:uncharacterized protein PV10_00900 [Exophiala mesophila]KIV97109.1 hypothetical protein PV10_00900 [Exophiala mesophila]